MPIVKNMQAFIVDALQRFITVATTVTSGTAQALGSFVDLKGFGFAQGTVVIDVSAIKTSATDEVYTVDVLFGIDDASYESVITTTLDEVGRIQIPFNNQRGEMFNSVKLQTSVVGTSPSITIANAFITDHIK